MNLALSGVGQNVMLEGNGYEPVTLLEAQTVNLAPCWVRGGGFGTRSISAGGHSSGPHVPREVRRIARSNPVLSLLTVRFDPKRHPGMNRQTSARSNWLADAEPPMEEAAKLLVRLGTCPYSCVAQNEPTDAGKTRHSLFGRS
jgi:hypothetical protein